MAGQPIAANGGAGNCQQEGKKRTGDQEDVEARHGGSNAGEAWSCRTPPPCPPPKGEGKAWLGAGRGWRRQRLLAEIEAVRHIVGRLVPSVDRGQAEGGLAELDQADVG